MNHCYSVDKLKFANNEERGTFQISCRKSSAFRLVNIPTRQIERVI